MCVCVSARHTNQRFTEQIQLKYCIFLTSEIRMIFIFLKFVHKTNKKDYSSETTCGWPKKLKYLLHGLLQKNFTTE